MFSSCAEAWSSPPGARVLRRTRKHIADTVERVGCGGADAVRMARNAIRPPTTTGQTATLSSFDTDGFTLAWTKNGAPTGTVVYYALCFR